MVALYSATLMNWSLAIALTLNMMLLLGAMLNYFIYEKKMFESAIIVLSISTLCQIAWAIMA
jgi:hypothetical protein